MKARIDDHALAGCWSEPAPLGARGVAVLTGPTAGGKSDAALALAPRIGAEIVCCDAMQIYRGLDIGTAKPDARERALVPHHLFDIRDPAESYSVAEYVRDAMACIEDILGRGKRPLLVGGSALYVSALVEGMRFPEGESSPELRAELEAQLAASGIEPLYRRLQELDPEAARLIHPNNRKRVLRSLELLRLTGRTRAERAARGTGGAQPAPASAASEAGLPGPACADYRVFCLSRPRELLYARIDARVERMLEQGLLDEARRLWALRLPARATCMQAIAYKEFFPYFEGRAPLEDCVATLKARSRQYAKRQLSWFRAKPWPLWLFPADAAEAARRIAAQLLVPGADAT